ncbi:MAG TPA: NYN domain-containing protein, partial [Albitalea sp.]|nr:NYN domain-containing protein [Albitalea sp.]
LSAYGETSIRRAYGNWTKAGLRPWADVLHPRAIRPVQQYDYSRGKNASDMAMVVDAMALLYNDHPDAFGIVSSDADFTPLVMHLKAKGAQVFGFGAKKTPMPFVNACSRFLYLENLGTTAAAVEELDKPEKAGKAKPAARRKGRGAAKADGADTAAPVDAIEPGADVAPSLKQDSSSLKRDARLVTLLRNAVESAAGEDGWSPLGSVGQQIGNQASFDPRNYGYRKLIDLIEATQLFDLDRRGSQFVLRDKRHARPVRA